MRVLLMLIPYAGLAMLAVVAPVPSSGGVSRDVQAREVPSHVVVRHLVVQAPDL